MAQDEQPKSVDGFYARVRRNPVVASLVVASTVVIAIASFTDAANKLLAPFRSQSPAAARTQLAQMNVAYDADAFVKSAAAGDLTAVKLFLTAGMDPNTISDRQGSALGNAALRGRNDVVTALLAAGAKVRPSDDRPSALGSAAANGHNDLVRLLLDRQPPPDAAAIDEAFTMAAQRYTFPQQRNVDAMKLLAARGAHVAAVAPAIFQEVWQRGLGDEDAAAITRTLLDMGADVNGVAGSDGKVVTKVTPLMGAAAEGYRATLDLLLARGARIDVRYDRPEPDDRQWTALLLAVRQRRADVAGALTAHGANVDDTNSDGDDALLLASHHGEPDTMKVVLAKATRLDVRGRDGRTPLMQVVEGVRWPGIAPEVQVDTVKLLLDRGARVDVRGDGGETALMIAAETGSPATVKLLLERGARTTDRDAKGRRAIDHAKDIDDPVRRSEIVRLLQKAG